METATYKETYSVVFNTILQSINRLGWTIENKDTTTGTIIASTGASLRSWGERITIQVSSAGSQTNVSVTSKPAAQLFDWGKSKENERRIIKIVSDKIKGG